ncbi:SDR family oxidoreductase [Cryptosporangium japonicum]
MTDQKVALVTGANRGLGAGAARHLTRAGLAVLGTYHRGADEAAAVSAGLGDRVAFLPLDVTRPETFGDFVTAARTTIRERFGAHRLDYLVNNAGIGVFAPFAETTPAQFDELVAVNLRGPFFLTQSALPLLADGARILNVTTALTRGVVPGMAAYAATKSAVEALTRYQAVELADRRIRVNTLMGGAVDTDFGGGLMHAPQVRELAAHTIAQGRIATVDDITAAVPAVLSDAF